jgi:Winged helix DNA-binding domain
METRRLNVTGDQVAAFRLERHHLTDPGDGAGIVGIAGDVCGIQAQVMSSAELALFARCRTTTRAEIRDALWQKRSLVKTALMRITLHLVPAAEYTTYITALREAGVALVQRISARMKVDVAEMYAMSDFVTEALSDAPLTQQELAKRAWARASPRMRKWLKYGWSVFRPAIVQGLICYGPPKRSEVTFVRVDRWLPRQRAITPADARQTLARHFLGAYGPADARDFYKWSGMAMANAKAAWAAIANDLQDVDVDGRTLSVLARDAAALKNATLDRSSVRLLPAFDPLLLAHFEKDHLVERRHYKRVYRNQGWLSPVVLVGGRIAGVWFLRATAKRLTADVDLFARASRDVSRAIAAEADAIGRFLGTPCEAVFS